MRILLATYWKLPHVGGVWAYIQDLKTSLERLGHEVDVFALHPDEKSYYMLGTGQRVQKRYFKQLVEREIKAVYAAQQIPIDPWIVDQEIEFCTYALAASYFGLKKYDLIHAQDVISSRALWQIKPEGLPLINTIHGCLATEYWISLEGKAPPEFIWKYACAREYYGATSSDLSIVPTKWLQQTLASYLVPIDHMEVVPYGMNVEHHLQRMKENTTLKLPSNLNIIACPARLDKVKGHSSLLSALYKLKQTRSDWICLFIGDGYLRSELENQTAHLGLSQHVLFIGSRNDVPALLQQSDIVVLPSLHDNQPYAVMEAQISRKPLVVSNAGGIPEMVRHNHTGLMAKAGDSNELSRYLQVLLENQSLSQRLAYNGYEWGIRQWSLPKMVDRVVDCYEILLSNQHIRKANHPPKYAGHYGSGICELLRNNQRMYIPASFSIVDDHIVGSIIFQAR
ncbi:glycosyltransferase family 4 protein [Paenibacillus sp. Leaf72]|uniref:glycosyltransferase family 4 protein n=1 Tax=Paenibacillus sp. Leaf72 TaxID=1736234 RepID=UPI0007C68F71|nr:glycosyltransferase family 4 protein [Paenibacillus sp. Leaf72]